MRFFLLEADEEDVLDAVDLHCNIRAGEAGDLGDSGGVHFLQITKHDLPVEWLELADQTGKAEEDTLAVNVGSFGAAYCRLLDLFQADEPVIPTVFTTDIRCGGVVGDTKRPGGERAASVKKPQTPPEFQVDFLPEIAASGRICLIASGEAVKRVTVRLDRGSVKLLPP